MAHDFKRFPELSNRQMQLYYFDSPHKQITEDFTATVTRVIDGDTVKVRWSERNFEFSIRLSNLASPELNEPGGKEAKSWLEGQVLGKEVFVILSKARIEKWGRILADIMVSGMWMSEMSRISGQGVAWEERERGGIPNFLATLK